MTAPPLRLIVFTVAGQRFALPAGGVREILALPRLSHPPGLPEALEGLLDLGGSSVPVYRVAVLLGEPMPAVGLYTPLVLLELPGGRTVALLVDRVLEMAAVDPARVVELDPETGAAPAVRAQVLLHGRTLHLLDAAALLDAARVEAAG